jgi:multidrug resistance efflux pump
MAQYQQTTRATGGARRGAVAVAAAVALTLAIVMSLRVVTSRADAIVDVATAEVIAGDFVDSLSFRGEIKASTSALVTAPSSAGDLQIIRLARNGAFVKRGDVVVEFDRTKVAQTLAEKRTTLRQSEAEIAKARAQGSIDQEKTRTEQIKGRYDVERARLEIGTREVISRYDAEKAELTLSDAQQRVREVDARLDASNASQRAEVQGSIYKRDKAAADVALAEQQLAALVVRAPVDGPLMLQNLWRGPSGESEYREGDRAWSGAVIAEIPDPTTLTLIARVDEADRGRLRNGLPAIVTSDSLPGAELAATLVSFSTLARPDYTSWPPARMFDVTIALASPDPRARPGMSAAIRVAVDRLERTLLVPSRAVIQTDGPAIVYVATSRGFEPRPVIVARRSQTMAAIAQGVVAGDRVALSDPTKGNGTAAASDAGGGTLR